MLAPEDHKRCGTKVDIHVADVGSSLVNRVARHFLFYSSPTSHIQHHKQAGPRAPSLAQEGTYRPDAKKKQRRSDLPDGTAHVCSPRGELGFQNLGQDFSACGTVETTFHSQGGRSWMVTSLSPPDEES